MWSWASAVVVLAAAVGWAGADAHKIMCLGDSITRGYRDADGNFQNDGPYEGYRLPLWNALKSAGANVDFVGSQQDGSAAALLAGCDPQHEGYNGYTVGNVHSIVTARLASYTPDYVLLLVGTNDLRSSSANVASILSATDLLLTSILGSPNAPDLLLVGTPTPVVAPPRTEEWNNRLAEFNAGLAANISLRSGAGQHVAMVDVHATLDRTLSDLPDGLHPSDAGYDKVADAWYGALAPVIGVPEPTAISMASAVAAAMLLQRRRGGRQQASHPRPLC